MFDFDDDLNKDFYEMTDDAFINSILEDDDKDDWVRLRRGENY